MLAPAGARLAGGTGASRVSTVGAGAGADEACGGGEAGVAAWQATWSTSVNSPSQAVARIGARRRPAGGKRTRT